MRPSDRGAPQRHSSDNDNTEHGKEHQCVVRMNGSAISNGGHPDATVCKTQMSTRSTLLVKPYILDESLDTEYE